MRGEKEMKLNHWLVIKAAEFIANVDADFSLIDIGLLESASV